MVDLAFYNVGCENPRGLRRGSIAVRRLLRRLLRPIFVRQVEIFEQIIARLDEQPKATEALRLEMLENLVRLREEVWGEVREELRAEFRERLREEQDARTQTTQAFREEIDQSIETFRSELAQLGRRDDQLSDRFLAVEAFGWDHVALARRLSTLERHLEELLPQGEAATPSDEAAPPQIRVA